MTVCFARRWTPEMVYYLRANHDKQSWGELSLALGVTKAAVRHKLRELQGLRHKPETDRQALREHADLPLAEHPTRAVPGTEEKIAVMQARASAGYAVFHPQDGPNPLA